MLKNEVENENIKKSDRTRQQLMRTALQAFKDRGYDACTMRDLAKEAGVTAPAFYYYFRSKEEIIATFYEDSLIHHLAEAETLLEEGQSFSENLKKIILQRFQEFSSHREALSVMRRFAFDRTNELSPFHRNHRAIRKTSVDLFVQILDKSKLKWPAKSQRDLAQLLWRFHLLMIFYWIGDDSAGQKKSKELLDRSLNHLATVLLMLKLPGAQRILNPIFETLKKAGLLEDL